jgi:hypothetical protein
MKPYRLLAIAACSSLAVVSSAMVWIGDKGASGQAANLPEKLSWPVEASDRETKLYFQNERFVNSNPTDPHISGKSIPPRASTPAPKATVSGGNPERSPGAVQNQAIVIPPRWVIVETPAKASALAPAANATALTTPHSPAPIPLAFHDPPPGAAVNPQIKAGLEELQQNFVDAIGGPDQDPGDPAYLKRWITARRQLDVQFRLLVGTQQFLQEQMQVNNQAD